MTSRNVVLSTVVASAALSFIDSNAVANPLTANASAAWTSDVDGRVQTGTTPGGPWTLATFPGNSVSFSGVVLRRVGPLAGTYATGGGTISTGPVTFVGDFGTSTGTATSSISVAPATTGFSYTLSVSANVSLSNIFAPRAAARATGSDPQFVQTPGVFANIISLGPGSSIFTDEADFGAADASFRVTAPLLAGDLADIELDTGPGGLEAAVTFATDPRLRIIDPLTGMPLSAADVEARLRASALGTMAGLTGPLSLFEYIYDLTGAQLPTDASFGAIAEGNASGGASAVVPEPPDFTLLAFGILAMLYCRWRRMTRMVRDLPPAHLRVST